MIGKNWFSKISRVKLNALPAYCKSNFNIIYKI